MVQEGLRVLGRGLRGKVIRNKALSGLRVLGYGYGLRVRDKRVKGLRLLGVIPFIQC
jgi:hypothetical protein